MIVFYVASYSLLVYNLSYVSLLLYNILSLQWTSYSSLVILSNTFTSRPESGFSGLVVSMLASGTQVRGFKPSEKILSMPSFGGVVKPSVPCRRFVACKRSLHLPWKSHAVGKIGLAISCPYFIPSLTEVSHIAGRGAPLEMMGETKSGAHRGRSYGLGASGLQGPGSTPYSTLLYSTQGLRKLALADSVVCLFSPHRNIILLLTVEHSGISTIRYKAAVVTLKILKIGIARSRILSVVLAPNMILEGGTLIHKYMRTKPQRKCIEV
jgi:hypothetical protein